ncbi:hypothetical protein [Sandarakinorhabdus sp.]|uniref:hypothetical protein n=1 Tax=Sandarakinorhabdus sp. TaxID=1916663 RepID=UPI003F6FE56A
MTKAFVMIAIVVGLFAGAAQAAPSGNSFAGDVNVRGSVGKNKTVVAIGPKAEALSFTGVIAGQNLFKGTTNVRGSIEGNETVVAIGPGAKAVSATGAVLSEMP